MDSVWTAIGAIGALVAALAAGFAAWFTYRIMQAGQAQVKISQEQFRQSVEAEQDTHLPVLVPIEPLVSLGIRIPDKSGGYGQDRETGYNREMPFVHVAIKNAGAGIALNIWGIVFEGEPELENFKQTGQHHSHRYALPLEPGRESREDWRGGGLATSGATEIGTTKRYKLYAPAKPTTKETLQGVAEKIARLTLTYSDIFGRKHAAIYDLTAQMQWELVDYLRNVSDNLGDLEREALRHIPVYIAPPPQIISPEAQGQRQIDGDTSLARDTREG